ncbi:charybde [Danaus plexippus plexippus]|uniref:Charybde n=1 Tax=Danaus plexippus plexippus TaxID=278856 RepID=A0A212FAY9_DANPL|nr:charybde [Danaus plexippus plexippus]
MEILPVTSQFRVGFSSEKAWSGPTWREAAAPVPTEAALAQRLERELRAAKGASDLATAEVLVPAELLARAARQALVLAEGEPCGARGAAVLVDVAGRRLAAFKIDPNTVTTHEIHLHLEHDATNWTSLLPQFLKNLTRGGTIIISPQFTIEKKKLFRSQAE